MLSHAYFLVRCVDGNRIRHPNIFLSESPVHFKRIVRKGEDASLNCVNYLSICLSINFCIGRSTASTDLSVTAAVIEGNATPTIVKAILKIVDLKALGALTVKNVIIKRKYILEK